MYYSPINGMMRVEHLIMFILQSVFSFSAMKVSLPSEMNSEIIYKHIFDLRFDADFTNVTLVVKDM